jgi:hypothetical protein
MRKFIFRALCFQAFMCLVFAKYAHADTAPPCTSQNGLGFVCGAMKPEDMAHIPGTPWLIASGFSDGAGLKLVDTQKLTSRFWYTASPQQIAPDAVYACGPAPDAKTFRTRGLSLRRKDNGLYQLLVVAHTVGEVGRESIEIFEIDANTDVPALRWLGCLPMPEGQVANSVATYSDGTVLATVLTRPGTTITDFVQGRDTGAVYQWAPGDDRFRLLPGTELPGNNGLETARDDTQFYVVAFGRHSVVVFDRHDTAKPLREIPAPDFMPDNIHWSDGKLLAAGMRLDEPACGGTRKIIDGKADPMLCHRGYVVAEFDPQAGFSTVAYAEPNPVFSGVSAAVIIDTKLWLGSFQADRMAWRPLSGK